VVDAFQRTLAELCPPRYHSAAMDGTTRANWIYLFHGEDELSSHEAVQGLVARMMESPMGELNVATFDGEKISIPELVGFCQTVPFMSDRRLAVVTNLISRLGDAGRDEARAERSTRSGKKTLLDALLGFLPSVPDFCRLVFLEGQLVPERDPVLQAIRQLGGFVKAYRLEEPGVAAWIRGRASRIGCRISSDAVEELAAAVGPNARLLNSELVKLATYCGDRAISREDVLALVADARKASVFTMVDAVGLRRADVALRELRGLLADGDHPLRIVAMLIRQFRLLIQVKELSEAGLSQDEIARRSGAPFRSVPALQRQARSFTYRELERSYRRLLEYDLQVKTGARDAEAGIELLIADLLRAA